MYRLINANIDHLLENFDHKFIEEYESLLEHRPLEVQYQQDYRRIWGLNRLGFADEQWNLYFQRMEILLPNQPLDHEAWLEELHSLAHALYHIQIPNRGKVLAFSACKKLAHIINNHLPICDSKVVSFYLWKPPGGKEFEIRIQRFLKFYSRLINEYNRVIRDDLLNEAIQAFRSRFSPQRCTDERIIDFLIWYWVRSSEKQGLVYGAYT